jgi:hypothetical protein
MIRFEAKQKGSTKWVRIPALTLPENSGMKLIRVKTSDMATRFASAKGFIYAEVTGRAVNDRGQVLHVDE